MKIIRLVCLAAVLMNFSIQYAFSQKRVVIIGLDGFSVDEFKTARHQYGRNAGTVRPGN
ncbi:hypothetical protein AAHN97_19025 [Chitinophaga niabensis]|uniref:hypothetical protein n=1 Tax=Chitinophaga niabensis TaxID=536979 RepID=UPI0031B9D84A